MIAPILSPGYGWGFFGVRVPFFDGSKMPAMDLHDPMEALDPPDSEEQGRAEIARRVEIDDLKRVMSNKSGRRFVSDLLKRSAVDASSFDTNPAAMAFKEGVKWLGQRILDDLKTHCPDRYIEMLKESLEHDRSDASRSRTGK